MIIIPNSKTDVFLCTYDVNYDDGTYKTKAINSKGEEIFTNYDKVEAIQNNDGNNNLWYEEDILKIQKGDKFGVINLEGKEILKPEYDNIMAEPHVKNAIKIYKDEKVGIADVEGKILASPEYNEVQGLGKDSKDGYIVKKQDGKYGIVDFTNKQILEAKYDEISKVHNSDHYVVKQDGKEKLVKKDGTEVLNGEYDQIVAILKNIDNGVIYRQGNKYGVMKTNKEVTIEPEYETLREAKTGILIAEKDGKYGIIDLEKNKKVDFKYETITYNEKADIYVAVDEDYNDDIMNNNFEVKQKGILIDLDEEKGYFEIRQSNYYKYYNFKFEEKESADIFTTNTLFIDKKNDKYGFVDSKGNVVVDYIYDDASKQNSYGFAGVKKDGKWGVIDNKGTLIQEPIYNLEDYLKVDFIGRWHLGKDLNMNYYNQI